MDTCLKPEGLFLLGDNFYGLMPGGVVSPRWKEGFEDMYPASAFPGPCWAMLGNHDYDEEGSHKVAAELDYADVNPGTRWTMPAKWYRVDWPKENPLVTCLILDSNYQNKLSYLTKEEKAKQRAWMETELKKPRAPWTLAFGHHPLYSNGPHGDSAELIAAWLPLFQKYGVAAYFCGHDHTRSRVTRSPGSRATSTSSSRRSRCLGTLSGRCSTSSRARCRRGSCSRGRR